MNCVYYIYTITFFGLNWVSLCSAPIFQPLAIKLSASQMWNSLPQCAVTNYLMTYLFDCSSQIGKVPVQ